MTSPGQYGSHQYQSPETRALAGITAESYDKDQAKTLIKLKNDVGYMAAYMRKLQKEVDQANENFIQQIQSFIADFIVLLGGGSLTTIDFGDLRYVIQAIGALLGFQTVAGIPIPINLFSAAWNFFGIYIAPTAQFADVINELIDAAFAIIIDAFGEIPVFGQAIQQLAAWLIEIRDALWPLVDTVFLLIDTLSGQPGTEADDVLMGLFHQIMDMLIAAPDVLLSVLDALIDLLLETPQILLSLLNGLIQMLIDSPELLDTVLRALVDLILQIPEVLEQLLTGLIQLLLQVPNLLFELLDALITLLTASPDVLARLITGFIELLVNLPAELLQLTESLVGLLIISPEILSDLVVAVADNLGDLIGIDFSGFDAFLNSIVDGIAQLFNFDMSTGLDANSPLNALNLFNLVPGGSIPDLDASKITSGFLEALRIPKTLDTSWITSGTWANTFIPKTLDTSWIPTGTWPILQIPTVDSKITSVDASKILTGQMAQARVNITSIAAGIVSGVFGNAQIPKTLDNSWMPGIFEWPIAQIPTVDSKISVVDGSKITTGQIAQARLNITSIAAGIVTGTFANTQIPKTLDNTWIPSAVWPIAQIPTVDSKITTVDGSKITTGLIAQARLDITSIAAGIITGSFSNAQIPKTLDNSWMPGVFTWPLTQIPTVDSKITTVDGSKITTGLIAQARLDITSIAAGIVTGVFANTQIPKTLDNTWIPSAVWPIAQIPTVDSKITTVDGSKITTGQIAQARLNITSIATSILTGTLDAATQLGGVVPIASIPTVDSKITSVDASKILSGQMDQARVLGLPALNTILTSKIYAGSNLLPNPGFENPNFYLANTGGVGTGYSTEQAHSGSRSLKLIGNGGHPYYYIVSDATAVLSSPCKPGDMLYIEHWVYGKSGNVGGGTLNCGATFWDAAGVSITNVSVGVPSTNAYNDKWTKISGYITAPALSAAFTPFIQFHTSPVGDAYYFDDVIFREVTEAQSVIKQLFGGTSVLSSILAPNVPKTLDQTWMPSALWPIAAIPTVDSKITSVDASKILTGQMDQARVNITSIAAGIITGAFSNAQIPKTLDNTWLPGAFTWPLAQIPTVDSKITSVDASKILTGQMAQARVNITSIATNILSGTIDAVTQLSGTVPIAQIPTVDSKITSVDGSKILSGNIADARVPGLANRALQSILESKAIAGANLCVDPGFDNPAVWVAEPGVMSTAQSVTGGTSRMLVSDGNLQSISLTAVGGPGTGKPWMVRPGAQYYLEASVFPKSTNVGGGSIGVLCSVWDSTGVNSFTYVFQPYYGAPPAKGQWTTYSGFFTIPAGYDGMIPYVLQNGTPVGDSFYFDRIVIKEATRLGNSPDLQAITDNITQYIFGLDAGSNVGITDARNALDTHWRTTQSTAQKIADMESESVGAAQSGVSVRVTFSDHPNSAQMPNPAVIGNPGLGGWVTTYTGAGTSSLGVNNGGTAWTLVNNGSRIAVTHHPVPTNTDYQKLNLTVSSGPTAPNSAWLVGRCNAANTEYIGLKVTNTGFLAYAAELGWVNAAGTFTRWAGPTALPTSVDSELWIGTGLSARQYQYWMAGKKIFDVTEPGTSSLLDANHRFWGIRGDVDGSHANAAATYVGAADNKPPDVVGSGCRITRTSTTTVNFSAGATSTDFPASYFDTPREQSSDITPTLANGRMTVTREGWYMVSVSVEVTASNSARLGLGIKKNGVLYAMGSGTYSSALGVQATFIIYLNAGEYVNACYANTDISNWGTRGQADGSRTFLSISLLNRSYA